MKVPFFLLSLSVVMSFMGCTGGDDIAPSRKMSFIFHYEQHYHEAGTWGTAWQVRVNSAYHPGPFRVKHDFSGPGKLFHIVDDYLGRPVLVPIDTSLEYATSPGTYFASCLNAHYMPPLSNDGLPDDGSSVRANITIQVFNPATNKWESSYNNEAPWQGGKVGYFTVSSRHSPGSYYLKHDGTGWGSPDDQPTSATVRAGDSYMFLFDVRRPKPGYDLQIQHELAAQGGYSGHKGRLTVAPYDKPPVPTDYYKPPEPPEPPDFYTCTYTAPSGAASPIDIVATISYYDIWAKERRKFEFTLHVVP